MKNKTKEYRNYQIGVLAGENVNICGVRATDWKVSSGGLIFYDGNEEIIAWFVDWSWWKHE